MTGCKENEKRTRSATICLARRLEELISYGYDYIKIIFNLVDSICGCNANYFDTIHDYKAYAFLNIYICQKVMRHKTALYSIYT